jgi:hypothetical protein
MLRRPFVNDFLTLTQQISLGSADLVIPQETPDARIKHNSGQRYRLAAAGSRSGNTAVVFPTTLGQAFSSTTYTVPSTITRHMVTGLTPGAPYTVGVAANGGTTTVTVTAGGGVNADVGGVIGIGFPTSADPTVGGVITGHALIPPSSSGGSGGGSTCVAGTYTKVPGGYTSCTAPSTLIGEGAYVYDMSGQRVYWDHNNGMWYLISDGGAPKVYTKTGPTSCSGAGAPEQLISQGVTYYDTIEKRTYTQIGSSWVLTG